MKPNWYQLISRALDEGALVGWEQAHKHTKKPLKEFITDAIVEAQLSKLAEVITWEVE